MSERDVQLIETEAGIIARRKGLLPAASEPKPEIGAELVVAEWITDETCAVELAVIGLMFSAAMRRAEKVHGITLSPSRIGEQSGEEIGQPVPAHIAGANPRVLVCTARVVEPWPTSS